jgi:hypothetical protein
MARNDVMIDKIASKFSIGSIAGGLQKENQSITDSILGPAQLDSRGFPTTLDRFKIYDHCNDV